MDAGKMWAATFAIAFICGLITATITAGHNRNLVGWFLIGFFFGPLGVLTAVIVVATGPKKQQTPPGLKTVSCPRCNAVQNVQDQQTYECWQCRLVSTGPLEVGWQQDPYDPRLLRWYDGRQWTDWTQPRQSTP